MKNITIVFILSLLIFSNHLYSQKILKRVNQYVLIDINEYAGVNLNIEFDVFRVSYFQTPTVIGKIKIVKFISGKCAAKIIQENGGYTIGKNDFIQLQPNGDDGEKNSTDDKFLNNHEYKIIRRLNNLIAVSADRSAGFEIGNSYTVKRKSNIINNMQIGVVKLIKYKNRKYFGKIIIENNVNEIRANDYIEPIDDSNAENNFTINNYDNLQKKSNWLGYSSICAAIVASGTGYYFHHKADKVYNDYQLATTTEEAVQLYDETILHNNKSKIGFGVGGGLLAFGILYSIFRGGSKDSQMSPMYSVIPMQKRNTIGLTLQFSLDEH